MQALRQIVFYAAVSGFLSTAVMFFSIQTLPDRVVGDLSPMRVGDYVALGSLVMLIISIVSIMIALIALALLAVLS